MYHIFHNVTIKFSIKERIKILFGKSVKVEVKIKTGDENVQVLSTKTDVSVDDIFKRRTPKIGYQYTPCTDNCGMNYCDENGCTERKRVLSNPTPPYFEGI